MKELTEKYWFLIILLGLVSSWVTHTSKTIEFTQNKFLVSKATSSTITIFDGTTDLEINILKTDVMSTGDTTCLKMINFANALSYYRVKEVIKTNDGYVAELEPLSRSSDGKNVYREFPIGSHNIQVFTTKKDEFLVTQSYIFTKK